MKRIIENVFYKPWYMSGQEHQAVALLVLNKLNSMSNGEQVYRANQSLEDLERELGDFIPEVPKSRLDENGIAHVPIVGTMSKRVSNLERVCGVTDTDVLKSEIKGFQKQGAKGFFFLCQSGGGLSMGTHELSELIAGLDVPTASFTDEMEGSAAYYALVGVDNKFMSPSAVVGSIGTYIGWYDYKDLLDQLGYQWNPVISEGSEFKAAGAGPELSEKHRAYFQDMTNQMNNTFKRQVTKYRPQVEEETMKGQVLLSGNAVQQGLVDFVANYEDAYDTLLGQV